MRKKNFKGRCKKRILSKCERLFKSYDPIQNAYADILEANLNIDAIHCNVELCSNSWGVFSIRKNNFQKIKDVNHLPMYNSLYIMRGRPYAAFFR